MIDQYDAFSMYKQPRECISFHRYTISHNKWRALYYRDEILVMYTSQCFDTKEEAATELFKYLPDFAFDKRTPEAQKQWDESLAKYFDTLMGDPCVPCIK